MIYLFLHWVGENGTEELAFEIFPLRYCHRSDPQCRTICEDLTLMSWKLQLPATVKLSTYSRHADSNAVAELKAKAKGKGKAVEDENCPPSAVPSHDNRLSTLDIFAGCGGLSEGLRQAGYVKCGLPALRVLILL